MNKYEWKCNLCDDAFADEKELAIHKISHLEIDASGFNSCPWCELTIRKSPDCFIHVLEHFSAHKIEQSRLMRWLSHLIKGSLEVQVPGKKRFNFYASETGVFQSCDFDIHLPAMKPHFKCLVCEVFYDPEIIGEHLLNHFNISPSQRKRIMVWFTNFFQSKHAATIEEMYKNCFEQFKIKHLSSNMLERLPMFENEKTKICRYRNCGIKASDSAELFDHYVEWHGWSQKDCWFCIICNFNASSKEDLFKHFHNRHIACIFCATKFPDFAKCLSHVKDCCKGDYCPYCKNKAVNFKELIKHLNKGSSIPICPYCKINFKSQRDLESHIGTCAKREPSGVYCLCCKQAQFTDVDKFNDHIIECRPGSVSDVNPCINGTKKKTQSIREENLINYSEVKGCRPRIIDDPHRLMYNFLLDKTYSTENTSI